MNPQRTTLAPQPGGIPPCGPGDPVLGCCLLQIPNTSEWQVVCTNSTPGPATIPTLSLWGGIVLCLALVAAACWRLR